MYEVYTEAKEETVSAIVTAITSVATITTVATITWTSASIAASVCFLRPAGTAHLQHVSPQLQRRLVGSVRVHSHYGRV